VIEGVELNEEFDLSGQSSDIGIEVKEAYVTAGFSEQDADLVGGLTTIVVGAGAGAAYVVIPPIPFLDHD
jgi:hypothetical protein